MALPGQPAPLRISITKGFPSVIFLPAGKSVQTSPDSNDGDRAAPPPALKMVFLASRKVSLSAITVNVPHFPPEAWSLLWARPISEMSLSDRGEHGRLACMSPKHLPVCKKTGQLSFILMRSDYTRQL